MALLRALAVVACLAGCNARIANGSHNSGNPDAALDDGGNVIDIDAASDGATTATCSSRVVYLNFEGVTLTKGASDATTNHASWMQISSGTAPPYHQGNANRQAQIDAITSGVRTQLASFPITVVTTRPATGKYVMIVLGGSANQVGSRFGSAVDQLDCGDIQPNDVAWISDNVSGTQHIVNNAIGAIGFGLGLTATTNPNDCMCSWDNGCALNGGAPCRLSAPIARDPNANQKCPTASPSQDEVAVFHKAFCE